MAEAQFFGLPDGSQAAEPDQAAALQAAGQRVQRLAQAVSSCLLSVTLTPPTLRSCNASERALLVVW